MSSEETNKIEELQKLIDKLCDEVITPQEITTLQDIVISNRTMRRHYIRMMHLHANMPTMLTAANTIEDEDEAQSAKILSEALLKSQLIRDEKHEKEQALLNIKGEQESFTRLSENQNINQARKFLVIPKPIAYATIAALLTLVFSLFWMSNQQITSNLTEHKISKYQPIKTGIILDQTNASWTGDITPEYIGDQIFNKRLTLTKGRATIQFNNLATITLKAPVTIIPVSGSIVQLIDGSLVGECEAPQSKGFIVNTPSASIKDLGTIFGINVSDTGTDEVHVFKGKIELKTGRGNHKNTSQGTLTQGYAVSIDHASQSLTHIDVDVIHFAAIAPSKILLNRNLVKNGDFETGPYGIAIGNNSITNATIPDWIDNSDASTAEYRQAFAADTTGWPDPESKLTPTQPGRAYYVGNNNSQISQIIDLSDLTQSLESNTIEYHFSAYIGGYRKDEDKLEIILIFNDQNFQKIDSIRLKSLTPEQRSYKTGFYYVNSIGIIPEGTKSVKIILNSKLVDGELADKLR